MKNTGHEDLTDNLKFGAKYLFSDAIFKKGKRN